MHILQSTFVLVAIAILTSAATDQHAHAQSTYYDHSESNRLTRLWIPNGVQTVRGILVFGNGAGGDSTSAAQSAIYQRFGDLHNFAVIGTGFWGNFSDPSELDIWDNHLDAVLWLQCVATGKGDRVHRQQRLLLQRPPAE
jgi:hypothetical protein